MGKSNHENAPRESQCCASSHKQSDSDDSESQEDLEKSTEWIFQGYFIFGSDGWLTDQTFEAEVQAVVEQLFEYLPKVPVPIQHMANFYHSVT